MFDDYDVFMLLRMDTKKTEKMNSHKKGLFVLFRILSALLCCMFRNIKMRNERKLYTTLFMYAKQKFLYTYCININVQGRA